MVSNEIAGFVLKIVISSVIVQSV